METPPSILGLDPAAAAETFAHWAEILGLRCWVEHKASSSYVFADGLDAPIRFSDHAVQSHRHPAPSANVAPGRDGAAEAAGILLAALEGICQIKPLPKEIGSGRSKVHTFPPKAIS